MAEYKSSDRILTFWIIDDFWNYCYACPQLYIMGLWGLVKSIIIVVAVNAYARSHIYAFGDVWY